MSTPLPMISCICPTTAARRAFLPRVLAHYDAQTYTNREIIFVEDGTINRNLSEIIPDRQNIQYIYVDLLGTSRTKLTIGAKRNLAIAIAKGSLIAFMDDDDWRSPDYLARLAEPIIEDSAEVSGMLMDAVYNISTGEMYRCTSSKLHHKVFKNGVHTGTLMFKKELWNFASCFPNKSSGEDADFLAHLMHRGARLACVPNNNSFVYIRQESNTWPLPPHPYPHMDDWQHVAAQQVLPVEDIMFYRSFRRTSNAISNQ